MTPRRSRMRRMRTDKPLALTLRDLAIFRWLGRYRYLRSTYLHAFAGGASVTRFKERLGDLFHEGFLDRPAKQWEFADARCRPALYEIGEAAKRLLREEGGGEPAPRTFFTSKLHRQFSHTVMICECLASIELATMEGANLRFIPWSEILARAPEATRMRPAPYQIPCANGTIIPDAVFGLEYRSGERKAYRFFALEVDRATMPLARADSGQTSLLGKLEAYQTLTGAGVARSHLGIPNLLVLTVTIGRARLAALTTRLAGRERAGAFLCRTVEPQALTAPATGLLAEPWERAGLPPLHLGEWREGQPPHETRENAGTDSSRLAQAAEAH